MAGSIVTEGSDLGRPVYRNIYRTSKPPACILGRDDLVALFEELEDKGREGVQIQLTDTLPGADQSEDEFEALKARAIEDATLSVFVHGADGENVFVQSAQDLKTQRLPARIATVTFDSASRLSTLHNWQPDNRFRIVLDFTEPPGFDRYDPTSSPTPNGSQIDVNGTNSTWVTGVHESILAFCRARGVGRGWLHDHGIYNLYNWLIALPASLWLVFRIEQVFGPRFASAHVGLRGAVYIYLFLVAYLVARGVAYGFRWVLPMVEFQGSRSKRARVIVSGILSALLLALLYDVLSPLPVESRSKRL
jgi:hypothetical protein